MSDLPLSPEDIAAIRQENESLRAERDTAIRQATDEARRADGLHNNSARREAETAIANLTTQEQTAEATITAATQELTSLKRELAALYAEGNFEAAGEIQEKIGDATARRSQAQQAKTYYGSQREQAARQPTDPVERFFAVNPQFTEAEKTWIKTNPRYATDTVFRDRVNNAHAEAIRTGLTPQSPEYFQHLEASGYMRATPTPRPAARTDEQRATGGEVEDDNPFSGAATDDLDGTVTVEPPVQTPSRPQPARSVAAAPSRRTPTTPRDPANITRLTEEQATAALAMSEYYPQEVQDQGEAGIYAHYALLNRSPAAARLRDSWKVGA